MTVGLVIVSHSARLAEGVVELAGQMAPGVSIEPAGGLPDGGLGTDYAGVESAVAAAERGDGVLLLYDLGSARMTAELVVEAADQPDLVRLADAPLVEAAVAAAVAAAGGADLDAVLAAANNAATDGETGADTSAATGGEATPAGPEQRVELVLDNEIGLHARPAAMLARAVAELDAEVVVRFGAREADGRSVLGLLGLAARKGDRLEITARGADAEIAIARVRDAVRDF